MPALTIVGGAIRTVSGTDVPGRVGAFLSLRR